MKWYTAIGCKGEDGEGRLLEKTDNQEKVLTEMETMLWAALTWTICAENRIYSQMYRVLCITFGKERATEWADEEDFYDYNEQVNLWGKNLTQYLDSVYFEKKICIYVLTI